MGTRRAREGRQESGKEGRREKRNKNGAQGQVRRGKKERETVEKENSTRHGGNTPIISAFGK